MPSSNLDPDLEIDVQIDSSQLKYNPQVNENDNDPMIKDSI